MAFSAFGEKRARLAACAASASVFHLGRAEAAAIVDRCLEVAVDQFDDVCATVGVDDATRELLRHRVVAHESIRYPI